MNISDLLNPYIEEDSYKETAANLTAGSLFREKTVKIGEELLVFPEIDKKENHQSFYPELGTRAITPYSRTLLKEPLPSVSDLWVEEDFHLNQQKRAQPEVSRSWEVSSTGEQREKFLNRIERVSSSQLCIQQGSEGIVVSGSPGLEQLFCFNNTVNSLDGKTNAIIWQERRGNEQASNSSQRGALPANRTAATKVAGVHMRGVQEPSGILENKDLHSVTALYGIPSSNIIEQNSEEKESKERNYLFSNFIASEPYQNSSSYDQKSFQPFLSRGAERVSHQGYGRPSNTKKNIYRKSKVDRTAEYWQIRNEKKESVVIPMRALTEHSTTTTVTSNSSAKVRLERVIPELASENKRVKAEETNSLPSQTKQEPPQTKQDFL